MMNEDTAVLTQKDLRQVARRWMCMAVNTYNYESQMAGSIIYATSDALRKIYADDNEYKAALNNHYKYFNTHPWIAPVVFGVTLAIESKEGIASKDMVQNLKTSIMGPMAGVGDTIIWVLIPTILGSISSYMALDGNPLGAILWMVLNLFFIMVRYRCVEIGYKNGIKLIGAFNDKLTKFTEAASILGLVVVGSLIPSVIKVTTPLNIHVGEVAMKIQPMLDKILPGMLPVLFTWGIYRLIKNNTLKIIPIIFLTIAVCMAGAAFNILS
ncbi:TPA: PTS system mannose/fructose/sorbose family transporter subunit IID [Salmonella enterica subsp. salamae serovar 30:g,m,s:e,n,x]|nr:PTS system mannose/fructose/sorbose family transporter subunit IID [Salmonella enterica]HCM1943151.1 PTS system mannose/fructose/sorbose family transporter subunit IID [Salmonella enterica subsp. salamae serovar 30:g,m,s:e,n,x]